MTWSDLLAWLRLVLTASILAKCTAGALPDQRIGTASQLYFSETDRVSINLEEIYATRRQYMTELLRGEHNFCLPCLTDLCLNFYSSIDEAKQSSCSFGVVDVSIPSNVVKELEDFETQLPRYSEGCYLQYICTTERLTKSLKLMGQEPFKKMEEECIIAGGKGFGLEVLDLQTATNTGFLDDQSAESSADESWNWSWLLGESEEQDWSKVQLPID